MDILKIPNPILTTKAEQVTDFSNMESLSIKMIETAKENNLAGLACNQIGLLNRIFVLDMSVGKEEKYFRVFINPIIKVIKNSNTKQEASFDWEGCASIPNVMALVKRYNKISIRAVDIRNNSFELTLNGFLARVCQHEVNHLDSILMTSKAREIRRLK